MTNTSSLIAFFLLAFLISWGVVALLAGPGNIPIEPEGLGDRLPLLYVAMLAGPSVAGIGLSLWYNGRLGGSGLLARLIQWRIGWPWYVLVLLTAPLLALIILFVLSYFQPEFQPGLFRSSDPVGLALTGLLSGLMVGLLEEIGWTGFALPRLREHWGLAASGLLLGFIWGAWHFILFLESGSFSGIIPFAVLFGRLFTWLLPYRVFMAWLHERTGSLLLVVLAHMSLVFTVSAIVPQSLSGVSLLIWLGCWSVALWGLFGLLYFLDARSFRNPGRLFG